MAEFIVGICLLLAAFVLLSLLGHLCWLAITKFFDLFISRAHCKTCGQPLNQSGTCVKCNPSIVPREIAPRPTAEDDLRAAQRLLEFTKFNQWLPAEQIEWLDSCLQRLNQRLASPQSVPTTPLSHALIEPQIADVAVATATHSSSSIPPLSADPSGAFPHASAPLLDALPVAASVEVHPLDAIEPADSRRFAVAPAAQRVSTEILRSFMERSNIRWIELVSAALVVVCSVGLVISLWSTLSRTSRFFPSLVFMLATLAVHGAGQYTLTRWKLRTTSRGILHIGLMLIPLSVLVGILLSRREQVPELNLGSTLTVVAGMIVYAGLAFTAARSLFSRYYLPTTLLSVCASLTLVPIYYYSARVISPLWAASLLLPLVALSAAVALWLSWRSMSRTRWTPAFARRHMGIAVQALFAILTTCVFWFVQFKATSSISPWWWTLVGMMAAGWSSWAWAISLSRLSVTSGGAIHAMPRARSREREASWMIVSAWIIGLATTLFLLASCWQASFERASLIVLLAGAAAGWWLQGMLCRLPISLLFGSLAAIVALAIGGESIRLGLFQPHLQPQALSALDWISFERTTWLTAIGALTAAIGCSILILSRPTSTSGPHADGPTLFAPRSPRWRFANKQLIGEQFGIAGGLSVLIGAALTILASCVPWGATPYGGNWAPITLAIYGVAITATGILMETRRSERWIVPIGQALMILATVRICQTSSMLPDWLVELRPMRAWAVGLALLAAIWSGLAVGLSQAGRRSHVASRESARGWLAVDWLCGVSIALAAISAIGIWRLSDRFALASDLGWTLPAVALSVWLSWRSAVARQFTLLAACLWFCATLFNLGDARDWWRDMGLSASIASHALICIAACGLFVALWEWLQPPRTPAWLFSGPNWSLPTILIACMLSIVVSTALPAAEQLSSSLGLAIDLAGDDSTIAFAQQRPNGIGVVCLLTAVALLVAVTVYTSRLPNLLWLRILIAFAPIALALAGAAWIGAPWAMVISAWILAGILLASEGLARGSNLWREQSQLAWECQLYRSAACKPEFQWLALGRAFALAALLILSFVAVVQGWRGLLASEMLPAIGELSWNQAAWFTRTGTVLVWLGPVLSVLAVRWLLSVVGSAPSSLTNLAGALAGLTIGCLCSLTVTAIADRWIVTGVTFLQAAAATFATLAGLTALYALSRNFMALKVVSQNQIPRLELLAKSCKGGRWKKAETSAWSLVRQGLFLLSILCVLGAATIVWVPVTVLPSVAAIASWPSLLAYVSVVSVFIALGRLRAISHFELWAVCLGVLAPLLSNFYAHWLHAAPERQSIAAAGFEPFRAQVTLWIVALVFGLAVRIGSRGRDLPFVGEALWVALAAIVGALGLVGSAMDPEKIWPAGQLSALAMVTVLSSLASGQSWRGHLAAMTAAIGIVTYQFAPPRGLAFESFWLMLWGPVWVAATALVWTVSEQWLRRSRGLIAFDPGTVRRRFSSVDQTVSIHVPIVICILSGLWIVSVPWRGPLVDLLWISVLAASTLLLAVARLWDWRSGQRGLAVYLAMLSTSLTGAVVIVELYEVPFRESALLWMAAGLLALAIMAGCLREWMRESSRLLPALRLGALAASNNEFIKARQWMVPLHSAIGMCLLLPWFLLALNFGEQRLRLATAALPFISAIGILPIAIDSARRLPRVIGLILVSCAALLFSWSDLQQLGAGLNDAASWQYFQRSFVTLVILSWTYAWLTGPLRTKVDWQWILHRAGWICLAVGAACGASMLVGAWAGVWQDASRADPFGSKLLSLLAWCAVIARCLLLALAPRGLDAHASIATRQAAVYAAELGLGFLTAIAYFSFPDLFSGLFAKWWPLIVFGIAMLSAAIGHWSARAGHSVLSDPVRRSSLLLILIPLFGVWWPNLRDTAMDWSDAQRFSLLLLIAASLYGLHGWLRPSVGLYGLSAALTLLSFWTLLYSQPDLRFFEHPQFWLLPPAIATLVFVELNRLRLHPSVVIAARYCAVLIAYLSSTAELLLKAFEGQMWQPLVLLFLAVLGVLAGIALRVRAFLYCGSSFVLVALLGMVWHAQQAIDQVWPWWAFGILTGISLIVMLGYFEKNRPRVLAYLDQLKSWEH